MGCCGKGKLIKNVAVGTIKQALNISLAYSEGRGKICISCEFHTWLTINEYLFWMMANRALILDQKKPLPKKEMRERTNLYCSVCKCNIDKKVRVKDNTCPKGKWDK